MQLFKKLSIFGFITVVAACKKQANSLFTLVEPTKTNINFANTIVENDNLNMINYQYLYNGGGVGIGDFNNDNQPDIYFTSSLGSNKLYLNKGNFQFQDITNIAGVDGSNKWCKGVSVVDINNDGKEDIYVAAAVWNNTEQRKNLLYVNQGVNNNGIPVFKNMAEEYGLADTSNTHMAAFLDYDKDGDLDVYLLVNDLNEESPNTFKPINNKGTAKTTDKLLRNDWNENLKHPVFTNVSQQAGITWEGYGLGINVTDINNDTWPDVLVSNDYLSGNILYINNQNGTFTNRVNDYFKHSSLNAMGNDVADINNDGLPDIIETDMAPEDNYRSKMMMNPLDYNWYLYTKMYQFPYQVVRNTLQINRGFYQKNAQTAPQPIFSEVAFAANVAYTDWSWAPLLVDVDNDGFKDLMVTNGLPKDITDLDFIAYRDQTQSPNLTALLLKLPEVKINNYLFKNNGNGEFTDKTIEWGWQNPGFSAGIATADFDNDGDMDVVINNTNSVASVYENKANTINNNRFLNITLSSPLNSKIVVNGAKIYLYYGDEKQVAEYNPYRGYMSSQQKMVHFGVGNRLTVDSVKVIWPNATETVLKNVASNQLLTIHYNTQNTQPHKPQFIYNSLFEDISAQANILFEHQQADVVDFNFQRNLPHKLSEYGPAVAVGDVNADGLHDMVIGGNSVQPAFIYFQQPDGHFEAKFLNSNPIAQTTTDAGLCLFDADNDNDLDLYIATSGFEQKDN
ncbi:MAG: CRTAC1 family protein, partial [Chitinophagaceae bacterium]